MCTGPIADKQVLPLLRAQLPVFRFFFVRFLFGLVWFLVFVFGFLFFFCGYFFALFDAMSGHIQYFLLCLLMQFFLSSCFFLMEPCFELLSLFKAQVGFYVICCFLFGLQPT